MRKKNELAVDRILTCAKDEFLEKGFEGASMRTIAERAGIRRVCSTEDLRIKPNCLRNS